MTPHNAWSTRARERVSSSGHGVHFESPRKQRDGKGKRLVIGSGRALKVAALQARMQALLQKTPSTSDPTPPPGTSENLDPDGDAEMPGWEDVEMEMEPAPPPPLEIPRPASIPNPNIRLAASWDAILPMLEAPFVLYRRAIHGKRPGTISPSIHYDCLAACGHPIDTTIRCLYISHFESVHVTTCACMPVPVLLVQHGVFPTSPTRPQTGVSIELLDIYRALFERSCDAIMALAAALRTIYKRRGFRILSKQIPGALATDPFREGLGNAVLWFSNLQDRIKARLEAALAAADTYLSPPTPSPPSSTPPPPAPPPPPSQDRPLPSSTPPPSAPPSQTGSAGRVSRVLPSAPLLPPLSAQPPASAQAPPSAQPPPSAQAPPPAQPPPSAHPPPTGLTPGRADRVLRERCPACFGLKEWGRSLSDGGDIQFGANGCFSYQHVRSAGDGPISYDPQYFISKDKVNKVRERIAQARKKPPARFKPPIPQAAVDACSQSWDAANENKKKADPKQYDSTGIFALTCRHSQVLFLCDIDTPGERQEYIVACLEEVNSLLPSQATILEAYDVGCVADNSFNMFSILSEGLRPRVGFVINAMHAYGHQWICQLVYSPRLRRGAGLSDHEGVERIWSRIRRLIPLTRHQWKSRRIWTLDQYMAFVNDEGRDGLGAWIERQRKNLTKKQSGALKVLQECRIPESELRLQWQAQKAAQTSVRSYAPTRLRHELEKIIALQTQIDAVEKSIAEAKASITSAGASTHSITLLKGLEATHETLSSPCSRCRDGG
ncbi:hypothetical protein DFH07DRAFT_772333 [Mycena maculata]|uniref:CxC1-like cysteine cluster associated with KDZ transposases domain-containing protein n=1 Tax=Mycena maculata TaxID=230809 RepID=A0AAD7JB47_9AGAR|nr:hypothetical protein DFH07DRAFT_772333 [Mycena maculata]